MFHVGRMGWRIRFPLAVAALVPLVACSSPDDVGRQPRSSPTSPGDAAPSSSTHASDPSVSAEAEGAGTAIRVRIGGTVLTARLRDVPATRDLVAQLPLTLPFRDF